MAHAFSENPAVGRTLSVGVSLLFWGAVLWGVSQMRISLPEFVPPKHEPGPITMETPYEPPAPTPKPYEPPKVDKPAAEITDLPTTKPLETTISGPDEITGDVVMPPPMITNPTWIRKPSMDDMMGLYPYAALERGQDGRVVLDCLVAANGRIACAVVSETPAGKGFGNAALKASRLFQIAPSMVDGRPTEGGRIRVPISFQAPKD